MKALIFASCFCLNSFSHQINLFYWFSNKKESFWPYNFFCWMIFFSCKVNFFLQLLSVKQFSFCEWNLFLYRKFSPVQEISSRNICLSTWGTTWCDIKFSPSSWDRTFFPVTRNFFLWQEISSYYKQSSCDKKYLTVARNFLLWQDISSWGK